MSTKNTQPAVVYTIGHSNRPIDSLLAMLGAAGIEALIDIRAQPGSQRFPQFESDALRRALNATGMDYHWAGRQFGGRRQARPDSAHRALATEDRVDEHRRNPAARWDGAALIYDRSGQPPLPFGA